MDKRRAVTTFQRWVLNPIARRVAGRVPGWVVLETVGRVTRRPIRTPMGGRRRQDTVWVVSEFGRQSNWVRNIEREPNVRVRVGGRWLHGRASPVPGDDPIRRAMKVNPVNGVMLRIVGRDPVTVRIELDQGSRSHTDR